MEDDSHTKCSLYSTSIIYRINIIIAWSDLHYINADYITISKTEEVQLHTFYWNYSQPATLKYRMATTLVRYIRDNSSYKSLLTEVLILSIVSLGNQTLWNGWPSCKLKVGNHVILMEKIHRIGNLKQFHWEFLNNATFTTFTIDRSNNGKLSKMKRKLPKLVYNAENIPQRKPKKSILKANSNYIRS